MSVFVEGGKMGYNPLCQGKTLGARHPFSHVELYVYKNEV